MHAITSAFSLALQCDELKSRLISGKSHPAAAEPYSVRETRQFADTKSNDR